MRKAYSPRSVPDGRFRVRGRRLASRESARKGRVCQLVQPRVQKVPARRGDAALVLYSARKKPSRRSPRRTIPVPSRPGIRFDPDVKPAPGNRRPRQERAAGAGRDRQGTANGAKTERERDYSRRWSPTYEDFANRPERARQLARASLRGARGEIPGRRRGADLLRAVPRGTQLASDQCTPRASRPPGSSRSSSPSTRITPASRIT